MFENALPVWIDGRSEEMHLRVQFKCVIEYNIEAEYSIRLATSGTYNLFVNGEFVSYGPARAGKGHFRIDVLDITKYLKKGENTVIIEVCGYYATSFYIQKQPSFLIAEIYCGGKAVKWTGEHFSARINPFYIQKTQRYSYQRPMIEAYKIKSTDSFLTDITNGNETLSKVWCGKLLERCSPYPRFERISAKEIGGGTVGFFEPDELIRDRSLINVGEHISGFDMHELELCVTDECQHLKFNIGDTADGFISDNTFGLWELPFNATGMTAFDIECQNDMTLYVLFDEVLTDGGIDFLRGCCANAVKYTLSKGEYSLKFFEVYTMKYIKFIAVGGDCRIKNVGMIEYKHPMLDYDTSVYEPSVRKIADAAIETYRQNSVDLFVDCPSRERAGWLCDSFFSARTEYCLTGKSDIECGFLENFLHEDDYAGIPVGMLPMCYPADHLTGEHIPNWAMWLVIQLEEYFQRTNDSALISRYENKVNKLFDYFSSFENSDGLLERLDGWIFVEWSMANELVQDVNYPTNMVYSAALAAAGRLYNRSDLTEKAESIKQVILQQSFNGKFFSDNAVREGDKLTVTNECTEVCQYYAFFFDIANRETHAELWNVLTENFGPDRDCENTYPEIYPANAFIGNYLRLDTLMRYGQYDKVYENIIGYFGYMADRTGTLWENVGTTASCDHGFASYVICWLDTLKKKGKIL